MEAKARHARALLQFLAESFQTEAPEWAGLKEGLTTAADWCKKIAEACVEDNHKSSVRLVPTDPCSCSRCKAEKFVEVLASLDKEQIMEIIVEQEAGDAKNAPCVSGLPAPQNEVILSEAKE